ncbi:MAG: bifunctional UDP-N-acetylglucosamine diphosphorylase/glucosamine-1-phosphate N-acetyltransferase GlmU [Myxococcota bacterium]
MSRKRPESKPFAIVVMAAGEGVRFKSRKSKLLFPILGKPIIDFTVDNAVKGDPDKIVVVLGEKYGDEIKKYIKQAFNKYKKFIFAIQRKPTGTADAVRTALKSLGDDFNGDIFILSADVPLIYPDTLHRIYESHKTGKSPLTILTSVIGTPFGYGRVIRDKKGEVEYVVEQKDASEEEAKIKEVNAGVYMADSKFLRRALSKVKNENKSREYYLTDIVAEAYKSGAPAQAVVTENPVEILGVNDRVQLEAVERAIRSLLNFGHTINGVSIRDSMSTYIDIDVKIGTDVTIMPGAHLLGKTTIHNNVFIDVGCIITDSVISEGAIIKPYCVIEGSFIESDCIVGPFARLRPTTILLKGSRIGNFVETKEVVLGENSKANHLSYLGDAKIGDGVNIGAGTITCNYDGKKKHRTEIADGVFVGSDTQLVAPVRVGKGAYIASGTTVTKDVPPSALAVSRTPQENIEGWAKKRKPAKEKSKK